MFDELFDYIRKGRKQGFSFDDIAVKLQGHGWNPLLVEHAIRKVQVEEGERTSYLSIWMIVAIFLLVVGIVYLAAYLGLGPNKETFCIEPGVFGLVKQTEFAKCCQYAGACRIGDTYTLTDKAGSVIFAANNYCEGPKGEVIVRGDVLARC